MLRINKKNIIYKNVILLKVSMKSSVHTPDFQPTIITELLFKTDYGIKILKFILLRFLNFQNCRNYLYILIPIKLYKKC